MRLCDISIIWARDSNDNQVKGFIVENKTTPGFSVDKIETRSRSRSCRTATSPERLPQSGRNRLQGGNLSATPRNAEDDRYAVCRWRRMRDGHLRLRSNVF